MSGPNWSSLTSACNIHNTLNCLKMQRFKSIGILQWKLTNCKYWLCIAINMPANSISLQYVSSLARCTCILAVNCRWPVTLEHTLTAPLHVRQFDRVSTSLCFLDPLLYGRSYRSFRTDVSVDRVMRSAISRRKFAEYVEFSPSAKNPPRKFRISR